jgi:hypothetical protein
MALKQTIDVLNDMAASGVIESYAVGGAVAAFYYIEASSTDDLDILVSFENRTAISSAGLVTLGPIVDYLSARGFTEWRHEGIVISGWPVQFLPVADSLDAEALKEAPAIELEVTPGESPVSTRLLSAEHVMAIALRVGRPKDLIRISQFVSENAFEMKSLCDILIRHGLRQKWTECCLRHGIKNECA